MDLANDSLDEETEAKMTMVINKMFKQRESGDGISFDQFKGILKEYEGELTAAQLDLNIDGESTSFCTAPASVVTERPCFLSSFSSVLYYLAQAIIDCSAWDT